MTAKLDEISQDASWLGDEDAQRASDGLQAALDTLYNPNPPPERTAQAMTRLRQALAAEANLVVFYGSVQGTWLGEVWLAVSERGLLSVGFGMGEQAFVDQVRRRLQRFGRVLMQQSEAQVAGFARQLQAYLEGQREEFDLSIDLTPLTDFQRQVLLEACQIPRGRVTTYGEIARRIGRPRASRAVGQALGHNPIPIVIPCHRVVASDGSLRGYTGGRGVRDKARLLEMEGARLAF